jgi:hypothetical protein
MARVCTVCSSPVREAIDRALVAGEPNRRLAADYGLSEASIRRHKAEHLPDALVKAQAALEVLAADDLLSKAQALGARALKILECAEKTGDLRTALHAIRESRGCLELQARMVATALELDREERRRRPVTLQDIDDEIAQLELELARRERLGDLIPSEATRVSGADPGMRVARYLEPAST